MKAIVFLLSAMLALLVPTLPAAAQQVPAGSYLKSCDTVRLNGGTLSARCQYEGDYYDTSISATACVKAGDIANLNGSLACFTRIKSNWGGSVLPEGSYLNSCYIPSVKGSVLWANCRRKNGNYHYSSLPLAQCPGTANIANLNGHLTCTP